MEISIVIPLYGSENTITPVIDEIREEMTRIQVQEYEIILVNDCSPDNVLVNAKNLAKNDKKIKVISLAKNSGNQAAMMVGYRYSKGRYVVSMDDDYQTPGNEIGGMIDKLLKDDLDVVFAKYPVKKYSKFRLFGSWANYKMAEIMLGKPKDLQTNSFFVMRKFVRDEIVLYSNNFLYVYGIIFAITSRVGNAETSHRERLHGKSGQNLRKLFMFWLNGFLNFSTKPLRISTVSGFIFSFIAAVTAVWALIARILNPDAPIGWASTIITILFFSGIQLVSIGLLGEYLGRLYISSSKLPRAVVREIINCDESEKQTLI